MYLSLDLLPRAVIKIGGSGYFWLYDEERDLSSRPQMYVLPFTDARFLFHRCSSLRLPLPCGKATTGLW